MKAFGWRTLLVDGHNMPEILNALGTVGQGDQPLAIIAKTLKGAGISFIADKEGWHGKPLSPQDAERAVAELKVKAQSALDLPIAEPTKLPLPKNEAPQSYPPTKYKLGESIATRQAYGSAWLDWEARIRELSPLTEM